LRARHNCGVCRLIGGEVVGILVVRFGSMEVRDSRPCWRRGRSGRLETSS
jgi:hypothetical protein